MFVVLLPQCYLWRLAWRIFKHMTWNDVAPFSLWMLTSFKCLFPAGYILYTLLVILCISSYLFILFKWLLFFQSAVVVDPHARCNWLLFGHDCDPNVPCDHHLCIVSGCTCLPLVHFSQSGPEMFRWGKTNCVCFFLQRTWIRGRT